MRYRVDRVIVSEADAADLPDLLQLYLQLTPNNLPYSKGQAHAIFDTFRAYPGSAILLGRVKDALVASCTLVVIPNLTRSGAPYALIENVVTHAEHRRKGYAKRLLDVATARAWAQGCYKVMLMTGSKEAGTLAFYENAGFQQTKTGFQKRNPAPRN